MEPLEQGKPLQLIRCGDADDNYAFVLNDENLVAVSHAPPFILFPFEGRTRRVSARDAFSLSRGVREATLR